MYQWWLVTMTQKHASGTITMHSQRLTMTFGWSMAILTIQLLALTNFHLIGKTLWNCTLCFGFVILFWCLYNAMLLKYRNIQLPG